MGREFISKEDSLRGLGVLSGIEQSRTLGEILARLRLVPVLFVIAGSRATHADREKTGDHQ